MKNCSPEKILHPLTYNCVKRTGKIGKKILKGEFIGKTIECPPEKILNPLSRKCVKRTGKIGKKLLKGNNIKFLTKYKKKVPFKKKWTGESIYGYLSLVYLMKNNKRDCIVLTPPPKNKIAHQEWKNWELIWHNEIGKNKFQKLLIPRGFKKILKSCIRNPNIRFVLMNIGLEVRNREKFIKGHENFIIIDKKLKTAEHFEPHGYILNEPNYNLPKLYPTTNKLM